MKYFQYYEGGEIRCGVEQNGVLRRVEANLADILCGDAQALQQAARAAREGGLLRGESLQFAPSVPIGGKLLCVGLNYRAHAQESAMKIPGEPVLFSKFSNALAAHGQEIELADCAAEYDYEAELVAVIGKRIKNAARDQAAQAIFGYTAGNDLSARDLQMRSGQWLLGKSLDHFAPVGPFLVPADEISCGDLAISCAVNGEVRQRSRTSEMIFSCVDIVCYASRYMTLEPGDLIFTGTPEGVMLGAPEGEKRWLRPGDLVEVSIEGIGTLANRMK